jgi:hypothetical protein
LFKFLLILIGILFENPLCQFSLLNTGNPNVFISFSVLPILLLKVLLIENLLFSKVLFLLNKGILKLTLLISGLVINTLFLSLLTTFK